MYVKCAGPITRSYGETNKSTVGEFDCVAQQVEQDLVNAFGVSVDQCRHFRGNLGNQVQFLAACLCLNDGKDLTPSASDPSLLALGPFDGLNFG